MKNAVNWFEIYTANLERAKKFYSTVFTCRLTDIPVASASHAEMKYAAFPGDMNGQGASGALVKLDVAGPGIGGTLVYFQCEDIHSELSRVEAAGGKIVRPKIKVGDFGYIALIQDTEGNMIGLHSMT